MIVLVPTRGRPQNAWRLIEAWGVTGARAHLMFLVDDDDERRSDYLALCPGNEPAHVTVGPPKRIGPWLNEIAPLFTGDTIGFMGDDHVPRTDRWDLIVERTLREKPGICYGNDLYMGERLPTAVFISGCVVDALGYMVPPGLEHWYLDDAWREWGQRAGCLTYLPQLIIEHMHPGAGKAEVDASYELTSRLGHADFPRWQDYERRRLQKDVEKIRRALGA